MNVGTPKTFNSLIILVSDFRSLSISSLSIADKTNSGLILISLQMLVIIFLSPTFNPFLNRASKIFNINSRPLSSLLTSDQAA